MAQGVPNPVVHLELRTRNLACACAFYTGLFGWRAQTVHTGAGDYLALTLGDQIDGGVVEHDARQGAFWLPYVQVADIGAATDRARLQGASVCVPPREGPAGWRSVVFSAASGMLALWQPKA